MLVADAHTFAAKAADRWGADAVRLGTAADTIGALQPLVVLEPADALAVASMLEWAVSEHLAVFPRGSGTKVGWGSPPARLDAILSTQRLNRPIEHCAGDLTATIPAGCTLASANALLARERQWLPLDPANADRATIGGIVSANDSGPRRQRYGTPRDLIIGIEIALASGRLAKAGGRVVKNVAGYDLGRLLCGSWGTLAVITCATFKLVPVAPSSRTVVATVASFKELGDLALAVAAAPLTPTASDLQSTPPRLLIRFEATPAATDHQTQMALELCGRQSAAATIVEGEAERELWCEHEAFRHAPDTTTIKVSVLPSRIASMLERAQEALSSRQISWRANGRALGVLFFGLEGNLSRHVEAVAHLQHLAQELGGTSVALSTPPDVRGQRDWSAGVGDLLPLMRNVKAQFDPHAVLSPGRGPGGI